MNMMISVDFLENQLHAMGEDRFKQMFISDARCTGRSTRIALQAIAEAIENPGKEIKILDHQWENRAHDHLFRMVKRMIDQLGLRGFSSPHKGAIVFQLFELSPKEVLKLWKKSNKNHECKRMVRNEH